MENEVNQRLEELYNALERKLPRNNAQVRRAVERTRLTVADILAKHTSSDGTIPRSRIVAIQRDLEKLDGEIYRYLRDEIRTILEETAEDSTVGLVEIILAVIGLALLIEAAKLPKSLSDVTIDLVEAIISAIAGTSYRKFIDSIANSAFNRKGEDEKSLNDRIWAIAVSLRKEVEKEIRKRIQKGENISDILQSVDRTYNTFDWRLDTLVETETMYVMRHAVAKFAEKSGIVKALKIVDFTHGDPKVHKRHKCYVYAHADEHGMGDGVYPVSTRKIRNPHPRCRSMLLLVLADDLK